MTLQIDDNKGYEKHRL